MIPAILEIHPLFLALGAGIITWMATALGAATVFAGRELPRRLVDWLLGFAAGVMISASFWSLLLPAMEISEEIGLRPWFPPTAGFLAGGIFLRLLDRVIPHLDPGLAQSGREGPASPLKDATLLFLAVTLHNIPEALAVGVAFGALIREATPPVLASAGALTIGIAIQNLPEGLAVTFPVRSLGYSRRQSFLLGQASGLVYPLFAVIGALVVWAVGPLMPYALGFAAGAMIFVVVEQLIPRAQQGNHRDLATSGTLVGFAIMMALDGALG